MERDGAVGEKAAHTESQSNIQKDQRKKQNHFCLADSHCSPSSPMPAFTSHCADDCKLLILAHAKGLPLSQGFILPLMFNC